MLKGFREFVVRGNVIDLAVAVVIGAAFTAVVNSIVQNLFNPLIGAIFQADSLDNSLQWTIPGTDATLNFGAVFGAVITFVIVAAVVYFFVVTPYNSLQERMAKGEEPAPPAPDIALLTEIRDLLANRPGTSNVQGGGGLT